MSEKKGWSNCGRIIYILYYPIFRKALAFFISCLKLWLSEIGTADNAEWQTLGRKIRRLIEKSNIPQPFRNSGWHLLRLSRSLFQFVLRGFFMGLGQEGGGVSRVNIGRLITTSVTSRHVTHLCFSKWRVIFLSVIFAKDDNFTEISKLLLPCSDDKAFEK